MTLVLCLDDKGGMTFFSKRQSKDRILRKELLDQVGDGRLVISPYTKGQFEENFSFTVSDSPHEEGKEGDFLFVENTPLPKDGVNRVILYRWNRTYPADRYFSEKEYLSSFCRVAKRDFKGSSHEKITEEVWERKK